MGSKRSTLRIVTLCLIILLSTMLILSACAAEPTSTPTPTPTPPTPEPMELSCATITPPVGSSGEELNWWAEEVAKRTNGAVTIKVYWGGSLSNPMEMPEAIRMGTIDIAHLAWAAIHPQLIPLASITDSKVAGFRDKPLAQWMAMEALFKEFPEFDAELAANNMMRLNYRGCGCVHLLSRKPLENLDDLKGLKIGTMGETNFALVKAVGAVPVYLSVEEILDGLQKGVIDANMEAATHSIRFKRFEAASYFVNFHPAVLGGDPGFGNMMNLDLWNSLSPDVQQVFMELREEYPMKFAEFDIIDTEGAYQDLKDNGIQVTEFPAAEIEKWTNLPVVETLKADWINWAVQNTTLSEQRIREIVERRNQLIDEMEKTYPQSW